MKDLTTGSIPRHLFSIATVIGFGMLVQNLYFLVDLYFVSSLGRQSVAGVAAAGNIISVVSSLTQALGVGTVAMVSHASGRKDRAGASLIFNQSFSLAVVCAIGVMILGFVLGSTYLQSVGADAGTKAAGTTYLHWYLPALALQFVMISMSSTLRGTGVVRPTTRAQMITVGINIILAPILIAGWGTRRPLGVAGAAMATSLAVACGVAILARHLVRADGFLHFYRRLWKPTEGSWRKIILLGWPAGAELGFTFAFIAVVYWAIRDHGAAAQAGFGIGLRILQSLYLPAFAVAFSATPVAGQNYGARQVERVRATFRSAALICAMLMVGLTILCQALPAPMVGIFTHDQQVIAAGADFLRIVSWNLVAYGFAWTCSGLFQALGNTVPSFLSMTSRIFTFVVPTVWLSLRAGFHIEQLWYLWVASTAVQAVLSFGLLRWEFHRKLFGGPRTTHVEPVA